MPFGYAPGIPRPCTALCGPGACPRQSQIYLRISITAPCRGRRPRRPVCDFASGCSGGASPSPTVQAMSPVGRDDPGAPPMHALAAKCDPAMHTEKLLQEGEPKPTKNTPAARYETAGVFSDGGAAGISSPPDTSGWGKRSAWRQSWRRHPPRWSSWRSPPARGHPW